MEFNCFKLSFNYIEALNSALLINLAIEFIAIIKIIIIVDSLNIIVIINHFHINELNYNHIISCLYFNFLVDSLNSHYINYETLIILIQIKIILKTKKDIYYTTVVYNFIGLHLHYIQHCILPFVSFNIAIIDLGFHLHYHISSFLNYYEPIDYYFIDQITSSHH